MLISISASAFEPGNRVAVKHNKDEYFVGTVVKQTPTGVKVKYDDNGDVVLERGVVARLQDKMPKRKRSITSAEVKTFKHIKVSNKPIDYKVEPVKVKPALKKVVSLTKVNKTTKQVETVNVKQNDTRNQKGKVIEGDSGADQLPSVIPKPVVPPVGKDTTNAHYNAGELNLVQKGLKQAEYERYGGGIDEADRLTGKQKQGMLTLLGALHMRFNRIFFQGKLPKCDIALRNNTQKVKYLGMYYPAWDGKKGRIEIHPRLFVSKSPTTLVTTFIHEMCHQYVMEILKVTSFEKEGHGPEWTAAMEMCGLEAARYANQDTMMSIKTSEEQVVLKAHQLAHKIATETFISYTLAGKPIDTPVQWFHAQSGQWRKGVACCQDKSKPDTTLFMEDPHSTKFLYIPNQWLYLIPKPESAMFQTSDHMQRAREIRLFMEHNLIKTRAAKAAKRNERENERLERLDREMRGY